MKTVTEQKAFKPKYKIDDVVGHTKPNLFGENSGKITTIDRKFRECDKDRNIDPDGLAYIDNHYDWPSFAEQGTKPWLNSGNKNLQWEYIDEFLIKGTWLDKSYRDKYAVMTGFTYTVTTDNMSSVFSEGSLYLLK